jgi:hypothetical protein
VATHADSSASGSQLVHRDPLAVPRSERQRLVSVPRRAGEHRWLGRLLVAQGALGLGIVLPTAAILAGLLGGQLGGSSGDGSLSTTLSRAEATVADAAQAARSADGALASSATSATAASDLLGELATTMHEGAGSLRVEVLGQRPFLDLADAFDRTGDRANAVAEAVTSASPHLAETRNAMARLSTDLDELSRQLAKIRATTPVGPALTALGILAIAVLGWLSMAAAMSLAVGWRLLGPRRTAVPV